MFLTKLNNAHILLVLQLRPFVLAIKKRINYFVHVVTLLGNPRMLHSKDAHKLTTSEN